MSEITKESGNSSPVTVTNVAIVETNQFLSAYKKAMNARGENYEVKETKEEKE